MADLKILFWNINNTYVYKVHALKAEDDAGAGATQDPDPERNSVAVLSADPGQDPNPGTDPADESEDKKKDDDPQADTLFRARNRENREKISEVIEKINPDIAVLVEYSVGQYTLLTDDDKEDDTNQAITGDSNPIASTTADASGGSPNQDDDDQGSPSKKDESKSVPIFDRFGPYIYRTNLNCKQLKQGWDVQLMAVDCSDLSDEKDAEDDPGKQPFELYCVLWKKSTVKMVSSLSAEYKGKDQSLFFQPRNPAGMIFTLRDKPHTKFILIVFHAPHIKEANAKPPANNNRAGNAVITTQASQTDKNGSSEKDARVASIKDLSQLKRIDDAVHSTRKTPIVIAGNFELDYDKKKFEQLLGLGFEARIDEKTEFVKKEEDKPEHAKKGAVTASQLVKEADHVSKDDTSEKGKTTFDLTTASDNIFVFNPVKENGTKKAAPDLSAGNLGPAATKPPVNQEEPGEEEKPKGIWNFITEYCDNDVDQALALSNHLPIYVTVRLE